MLNTSSTIFTSSEITQRHTCCWLKRSEYCTMATQVLSHDSSLVHESCTLACHCTHTIMYSVRIQSCTVYAYNHVQCTHTIMYSVHIQSCTVYTYNHVQCTHTIMYSVHIQSCTVYAYNHVQCTHTIMYSVRIQSCTVYTYNHVQCTQVMII